MKYPKVVFSAMLFVLAMSSCHSVAEDLGWYIGGSVGQSSYDFTQESNLGDFDLDDSNTGWKAFGGYQSLPFLSIKAGYNDFGSVDDSAGGQRAELSSDGYNIWALEILPLGFIELYGKVGLHFYETEHPRPATPGTTDQSTT